MKKKIDHDQWVMIIMGVLAILYLITWSIYPKYGDIFLYDKTLHIGLGFFVTSILLRQTKNYSNGLLTAMLIILLVELVRSSFSSGGLTALNSEFYDPNEYLDFVGSASGALLATFLYANYR